MIYRVVYTDQFLTRIDAHIDYLLGEGACVQVVMDWYDQLYHHLDSLDEMPKRLPVDPVQTRLTGHETRKLNYGNYLVFYQVDDAHQQVALVDFQHGATRREID